MNNLIEQYIQIFKNKFGLYGTDFSDGDYCQISPIVIQNLLFQAVVQQDLTPIPQCILNVLCEKVKTKRKSTVTITYKELFQILKENNYAHSKDFLNALKQLSVFDSGYLTIGVCSSTKEDIFKYFKSEHMPDQRLQTFYHACENDVSGNTFSGNPLLLAKFKNACIFLNFDHIKSVTWKDTLSHQLSHFIQRVVLLNAENIYGNIERANIIDPYTGLNYISEKYLINEKFNELYDTFFKGTSINFNQLMSLFKNTLYLREEHTTIQNILNGFQRMYQFQKSVDKPNYKKLQTNHNAKQYEKQRKQWLSDLITKINNPNYFKSNGSWICDEFNSNQREKLISPWKYQQHFKNAIIILQYIGVKHLLPEFKIDNRLFEHFKTFKFRDN